MKSFDIFKIILKQYKYQTRTKYFIASNKKCPITSTLEEKRDTYNCSFNIIEIIRTQYKYRTHTSILLLVTKNAKSYLTW